MPSSFSTPVDRSITVIIYICTDRLCERDGSIQAMAMVFLYNAAALWVVPDTNNKTIVPAQNNGQWTLCWRNVNASSCCQGAAWAALARSRHNVEQVVRSGKAYNPPAEMWAPPTSPLSCQPALIHSGDNQSHWIIRMDIFLPTRGW